MAEDFVNLDFENTWEPVAVPEGEYLLRVLSASIEQGKKGPGLQLRLDIPVEPHSKDISHWLNLPREGDDIKTINSRTNRIKEILLACGVQPGPFNPEVLQGCQFWAYLTVEEDAEYGEQNRVRKVLRGA